MEEENNELFNARYNYLVALFEERSQRDNAIKEPCSVCGRTVPTTEHGHDWYCPTCAPPSVEEIFSWKENA